MKKILLILLAIAMVLSFGAGCNSNRVDDDLDYGIGEIVIIGVLDDDVDDADDPDDADDINDAVDVDEEPDGDPVEEPVDDPVKEPVELPPYPYGEIDEIEQEGNGEYTITILGTSKAEMEEYAVILTAEGWKDTEVSDVGFSFTIQAYKGDKAVQLVLVEKEATLYIRVRNILEDEVLSHVWPVDYLPQGFPEYPDGYITKAEVTGGGMIDIEIEGTNKETYDNYITTLKDAGWRSEQYGTDIFAHEGQRYETEFHYLTKNKYLCSTFFIDQIGWASVVMSYYG